MQDSANSGREGLRLPVQGISHVLDHEMNADSGHRPTLGGESAAIARVCCPVTFLPAQPASFRRKWAHRCLAYVRGLTCSRLLGATGMLGSGHETRTGRVRQVASEKLQRDRPPHDFVRGIIGKGGQGPVQLVDLFEGRGDKISITASRLNQARALEEPIMKAVRFVLRVSGLDRLRLRTPIRWSGARPIRGARQ